MGNFRFPWVGKIGFPLTLGAHERFTLSLRLRDGRGVPTWTLDALSDGLPPAWLGDPADAARWRGRLLAEGRGGEAAIEGELAQGDWQVVIAPSQVGLVDDRLLLRPLNLGLAEGPLRVTGQVQYGEDAPAFDLQLASEALRERRWDWRALLLPRGAGGTGEVLARLRTGGPKEPLVRLGNDFKLDSDLIERLIPIEGLANVALTARPERHLRLVE